MVSAFAVDESARLALIKTADVYFGWLIGSTIVLLAGAIVEYFNPFVWLKKSSLRIGTSVRPSRRWRRSVVISERLAIAMVVAGIAGEGVFEYLAARAESAVRDFDSRISIAAVDRANKAEIESGSAIERAAASDLARVQLEKSMQWRHLSAFQVNALCSLIPFDFPDASISVLSESRDIEAWQYANEFSNAMRGCTHERPGYSSAVGCCLGGTNAIPYGVWIRYGLSENLSPDMESYMRHTRDRREAALRMAKILNRSGIKIEGVVSRLGGSIEIYVGPLPPPDADGRINEANIKARQ